MRHLLMILTLLIASVPWTSSWGGTLNVPDSFSTIQAAIDAAFFPGDVVLVAPGVYQENLTFLGKTITVRSSDGPAVTVIDGSGLTLGPTQGSVVNFTSGD